ncbi:MAG: glutamyl-tRNA reductase [Planctomycetaceae bacterium]|nr:glutamyl-tRNA reductase [Planctomycetaceae bacterium]
MLRVIGLNHRSAPLEVREQLAFAPTQVAVALTEWQDQTTDLEAVLLSTCNRTEFYVATPEHELPTAEQLLQFLLKQKSSPATGFTLASQIFTLDDHEAAEHLFAVASGLDSMVLGEVQILSQVKSAYQQALDADTVGTWIHPLFQTALKTAKRVATETALHEHRISIPSIAVSDFARRIFERFEDKNILVFGAGEMGQETLRYLVEQGAKSITVLNRHRERAETLAAQFGDHVVDGKVADWQNRFDLMTTADIIISTTSADEPVVTLADYQAIEAKRRGRTLFVLDLAVPRDFDPAIAQCSGVYLYSVDDLQEVCNKNRQERDREIPKAEKIVKRSAEAFMKDMTHRRHGEVIQQLRERWTKTKETELHRLFNKLPELDEREQAEIRYAFERLLAKYLHSPLVSLREESSEGEPHKLVEALKKLFRL